MIESVLKGSNYIYNVKYDGVIENLENFTDLNNKLFCTFVQRENLEEVLEDIKNKYPIMYNKIFVLEVMEKEEMVITYNTEVNNVDSLPSNTIMVHRKKESNTLYTINALNELIRSLNGGYLDKRFKINWNDYSNSIMLTQHNELVQLSTKIYKIINL